MEKKTSLFENGLIWFGAGVSIAEILTGTYFASSRLPERAWPRSSSGHVIGCMMLVLSQVLIGGKTRKSAMETVKDELRPATAACFLPVLNVLQLVGWTAIMIYDGALAAERHLLHRPLGVVPGHRRADHLSGSLVGITNLGKVNTIAMAAPFHPDADSEQESFSSVVDPVRGLPPGRLLVTFGAAVELAVAMPLSWLPLISDYTREAEGAGESDSRQR